MSATTRLRRIFAVAVLPVSRASRHSAPFMLSGGMLHDACPCSVALHFLQTFPLGVNRRVRNLLMQNKLGTRVSSFRLSNTIPRMCGLC